MSESEDVGSSEFPEASRRTHFALERTLLAWWRTGIAVAAVALAIGGLLPRLGHVPRERFIALGVGYGILGLIFLIGGAVRDRSSRKALKVGAFAELPSSLVIAITACNFLLTVLTVAAFVRGPPFLISPEARRRQPQLS